MALFIRTASISSNADFLQTNIDDAFFHDCLDNAINSWILAAERSGLGVTVVDITITTNDDIVIINISYRAAQPFNDSLQDMVTKTFKLANGID